MKNESMKFIYMLIRIVNRLVPKVDNQILFISIPDFADNAKALFEYISRDESMKYRLIWIVKDKYITIKLQQQGINAYHLKSFLGTYYFLRSKYLFVTHNNYSNIKSKSQILINLWHGMPLKAMGFVDNSASNVELTDIRRSSESNNLLIATSILTKSLLTSCFFIDPRKICITGQPRNDKIFSYDSKANLSKLIGKDVSNYKKIVFFIPTFRKWGTKIDGNPKAENIFNFESYNDSLFNNYLNSNRILFIMKFHPLEEELMLTKFERENTSSNMFLLKTKALQENLLDLYDIIGATDILITDYSSIYFDFLLLNRPIIFVPTDLEEYSKSRGLILEPYDFWTPGPKATNFDNLIMELDKCIDSINYYEKERDEINNVINKYKDDKSCKRIFSVLEELER